MGARRKPVVAQPRVRRAKAQGPAGSVRPARSRVPRSRAPRPSISSATPTATVRPAPDGVRFFRTQALWRSWLLKNHRSSRQLWVGFWRVATGRPSINWPQSVDEALCFGWIDGLRRGLDAKSYAIRFTPRSATSAWSRVNLARMAELERLGRVRAAGRAALARWDARRASGYSHEAARAGLDDAGRAALRAEPRAWTFFSAQSPSYRRMAGHWVTSAKRPETRARRLAALVDCCMLGRAIPPLARWVKVKPAAS